MNHQKAITKKFQLMIKEHIAHHMNGRVFTLDYKGTTYVFTVTNYVQDNLTIDFPNFPDPERYWT